MPCPRLPLLLLLLAGCVPSMHGVPLSYDRSNRGWLVEGRSLPDRGVGFVRARRGESTRFGLPGMIRLIEESALAVHEAFPGGEPLRVGDISSPGGGRHHRHGSHRSGRDVDLIFFATNVDGDPIRGRGWVAFDRFGVGVEPDDRGGEVVLFDDARNWALVRAMLQSDVFVQWIFVSRGIKARLLRYASEHEADQEMVRRATWVLHQPSRGNPHADHFHVRIACGAEQVALGCRDRGPAWPWFGDRSVKLDAPGPLLSDEEAVTLLTRPLE